ncbi:MAG: reverse transcriptase-like protein [bacterium]
MEKLRIYSDVAINPEYKFAGYGVIIADLQGTILKEITNGAGQVSEMEARYQALIHSFKEAAKLGVKEIEFITSSKELVQNILKKDDVADSRLRDLYQDIKEVRKNFSKVKIGFLSYGDDGLMRRAYIGAVSGANPEEQKSDISYSITVEEPKNDPAEIFISCPKCKGKVNADWSFCPYCAQKLN